MHCHSHPIGNCISPRVLCSFTMRFAYFAPWGNVFWIQEFKNITMPSTGIPPFPNPPLVWGPTRPLYGGYGGGKGASKLPCKHQRLIVTPRGIARDTISPRGVGRTKAPPKHRQKSPPRGTGRTRKPKAPTKGNYDRSPANRFDFTCEISSVTRKQCVLQGVLRCPTLHFDVPGSLGQRVLHGVLRCPALSCI